MKIRSITLGIPPKPTIAEALARAGQLLERLAGHFTAAGYEVQTTRVSLPPLLQFADNDPDPVRLARGIDAAAQAGGVAYVALGPLRWRDNPAVAAAWADSLAEALAVTERLFATIETADQAGVRFSAAQASAGVIRFLAEHTSNGFGNLRFAALANCPPDIPFFPAAYHEDNDPSFGLALQAADLGVESLAGTDTLVEAASRLTARLEAELSHLEAVAAVAEAETGVRYLGADPTLAPFPDDRESAGAALEALGVGRFGSAGTLTAAAVVTRALRAVRGRRCGFAGLMLPVLEDSVLASRAAEGLYSWEELLLFSAVCGTGLDTVPLPGDVSHEELASMIVDVSSLSTVLQKPLTCRLFPIPGRQAGDLTDFDFPYFANAAVLGAKKIGSPRLLARGLTGEGP